MVKFVSNPPDAEALMTSARSFGNYDLAGAIADLIDNSIKAQARNIEIFCIFNEGNPEVRILDDGTGMSEAELHTAMRPASQNPLEERSPDDLGRFGWGMKSASFSQCRKLTVVSRRDNTISGASWDLSDLKNWNMGVLSSSEILGTVSEHLEKSDGTEIIWQDCDRLSEDGTVQESAFNSLVTHARDQLALIFHKYLSGDVPSKTKLTMNLNGQKVEPYDPFFTRHDATQPLEVEKLPINGRWITISPYILPHYSKLRLNDHDRLAGEEGFLKNQGFYVYRNHRLIISGTWFRLARYGELSQLVRISVDIPNSLDDLWKITVDKSDAQLPAILRDRLKQIVDGLRKRASRVYRKKGGRIRSGDNTPVWVRYARHGEIVYRINRDHPLVAALLQNSEELSQDEVRNVLQLIEQCFPVENFGKDAADRLDEIHQTEGDADEFKKFITATVPIVLADEGSNFARLVARLKITEPYCSNWVPVQEFLERKGWTDGAS